MSAERREVVCASGPRWAGRLLVRTVVRVLLTFAYGWPVATAGTHERCEQALDALVPRPVWWRTRARALVAELLRTPPAEHDPA